MTDTTSQSTPAKPRCCHPDGCTCVLFHGMAEPDPDCVWFGIPRTPLQAPAKPKPAPRVDEVAELADQLSRDGRHLLEVAYASESRETLGLATRVVRASALLQGLPQTIDGWKSLAAARGIHWPDAPTQGSIPECVFRALLEDPVVGPLLKGETATATPTPAPLGITLEDLAEAIRSAGQGQYHERYSEAIAEHLIDHPVVGPLLRVEAISPVPVAGRPWERPGWCDSEGRCWGFNAYEKRWVLKKAAWLGRSTAIKWGWRWLLPASAIPVPAEEGQS